MEDLLVNDPREPMGQLPGSPWGLWANLGRGWGSRVLGRQGSKMGAKLAEERLREGEPSPPGTGTGESFVEDEPAEPRVSVSEIRRRLLSEHRTLRRALVELGVRMRPRGGQEIHPAPMGGVPGASLEGGEGRHFWPEVQERLSELLARFRVHLHHEEQWLLPVLETLDAWGSVRREKVEEHHRRQRGLLDALSEMLFVREVDVAALGVHLDTLVTTLLDQMADEEHAVLTPALMKDDPTVADQECG